MMAGMMLRYLRSSFSASSRCLSTVRTDRFSCSAISLLGMCSKRDMRKICCRCGGIFPTMISTCSAVSARSSFSSISFREGRFPPPLAFGLRDSLLQGRERAALGAEVVVYLVFGQHEKVVADGFGRIQLFAVQPNFHEDILRDVLRNGGLFGHALDEGEERRVVFVEQHLVTRDVAADELPEQVLLLRIAIDEGVINGFFHYRDYVPETACLSLQHSDLL